MNLIKKLLYPFQKYEYSVPMKKEDFYYQLNKSNFKSETHDTYFKIRNKWNPLIRNSMYFTGRGNIHSSSNKTKFQVIFNMNIPGMIFFTAFFLVALVITIENIETSISSGNQITFENFILLIAIFLIYMIINLAGQILVNKFNDFIKSLNGEIFEYTKEIQNDK